MGNILFWVGLVGAVLSLLVSFWFIFKKDNASATKGFVGIAVFGIIAMGGLALMPEGGDDVDTEQDVEQSTELNRDLGEEEDEE